MHQAEKATETHRGLVLTIAIAYGGREEIADAVRSLIREKQGKGATIDTIADEITLEAINAHLYTSGTPEPDLIIRTSGEFRLSGFLLWQSAQSELYFCDVNWPEFRRIDFYRAVRAFQHRRRRYGQ
jgi:short-chain Z-isoprenyl diphosphate synthase